MKVVTSALLCTLLLGTGALAQSDQTEPTLRPGAVWSPFESLVQRARALDRMRYRAGFGMMNGPFYHLADEAARTGSVESLKRLLSDPAPLVRLLGLTALARSVDRRSLAEAAALLLDDASPVIYTDGCVFDERGTVGSIAREIAGGRF